MTTEELKEKVAFVTDSNIDKTIQMYVTTNSTGLQLFNIVESDLKELLDMFVTSIKSMIIDKENYDIENYSTSLRRLDVIHIYDLVDSLTDEMKKMSEVENIQVPDKFDKKQTKIEKINGIYIIIKDNDNEHSLTLFKNITNVDKTYAASTFFIVGKDNTLFERQKENMLKVTPNFQMLQIDNNIILMDINKLEKPLRLDSILERETIRDVTRISSNLVVQNNHLLNVCKKPIHCKKMRHALLESRVIKMFEEGLLTSNQIIRFAKEKTNLRFTYNVEETKFELKNDAEAIRFIKLMDDDYLLSELTGTKYDANDKNSIQNS